jgi:hypothetical protein
MITINKLPDKQAGASESDTTLHFKFIQLQCIVYTYNDQGGRVLQVATRQNVKIGKSVKQQLRWIRWFVTCIAEPFIHHCCPASKCDRPGQLKIIDLRVLSKINYNGLTEVIGLFRFNVRQHEMALRSLDIPRWHGNRWSTMSSDHTHR